MVASENTKNIKKAKTIIQSVSDFKDFKVYPVTSFYFEQQLLFI